MDTPRRMESRAEERVEPCHQKRYDLSFHTQVSEPAHWREFFCCDLSNDLFRNQCEK